MQNKSSWKPGKYLYRNNRLQVNPQFVSPGSRLIASRIADFYSIQIPRHVHGRLCDLGCGQVPLYEAYRNLVDEITCIDWANTSHRNIHLDIEADLSKPLPLPDESFDTIILSDVLEHLPEPGLLWNEAARLLDPDGVMLLNVPFLYWLHEEPHDFFRYTEFALRRYAEKAGFTVVQLEPLGGAGDVLADVTGKVFVRVPCIGRCCAGALQTAARFVLNTRLGEVLTNRTEKRFPLAYGMVVRKM